MIVEQELIEQIELDPAGWELARVVALVHGLGCSDPLELLRGMWRAGSVVFTSADGAECARHEVERYFREGGTANWFVRATERGSKWVHEGTDRP